MHNTSSLYVPDDSSRRVNRVKKLGGAREGDEQCRKIVLQCSEYRRVRCLASRTTVGPAGRLCLSGHSVHKRKRRTNGDIADVMLEKENLLSMSHNAMIPLPFLTASTEAEIVCIVDVKGNIRERESEKNMG